MMMTMKWSCFLAILVLVTTSQVRSLGDISEVTDPLFPRQWHLQPSSMTNLNVVPAWLAGYSGKDVGISIADDGFEWGHGDFDESRYMRSASYDWNGRDTDPSPGGPSDSHGTSCAGAAFAGMNDGHCGVGVAYGANFGAQRLIAAGTTDAMEATGLTYATHKNFIFSCSWGPTDDGKRKEGPGPLLKEALKRSTTARNGKGTIYVWAGGNGGDSDNVNYDGYANSIYTIAVAAINQDGRRSSYSEKGAPLIVGSPSSPPGIRTTAIRGRCTQGFGGTSAAAPMIAGVIGLILEANPDLTWRDVQDVLIRTATQNDPSDYDWVLNGARLHVNHKYGFGLADTAAACAMAANQSRPLLPPKRDPLSVSWSSPLNIPDGGLVEVIFEVSQIFVVEHVELEFWASHSRRGDLKIELVSPQGTSSVLAEVHGDKSPNYEGWTFTSVRHWAETSKGTWTLRVTDGARNNEGSLTRAVLILHGHN